MSWVEQIAARLRADFGGIPTFCEDPDGLLELPEVREALREAGMRMSEWGGTRAELRELLVLGAEEKPLLIVRDAGLRPMVETALPSVRWAAVSIGALFPRFAIDVVRSIPVQHWDRLLALHKQTRALLNSSDTAALIGRALFGIDPLNLEIGDGWTRLLAMLASEEQGLPRPIAEAAARHAPPWLGNAPAADILADPASARAAVRALLRDRADIAAAAPAPVRVLLDRAERRARIDRPRADRVHDQIPVAFDNAESVLLSALRYGEAAAHGELSPERREQADRAFLDWIQKNYNLVSSSRNPSVLRVSTLISSLHETVGEERLLLIVVDSLSLSGWYVCQQVWREAGIIGEARTRAAFAILPTLTMLSRRAIFEGKLPSQFSSAAHSQRLERKLWEERFPGEGAYFTSEEHLGIQDAFSLGRSRVCVLDVAWDKRGHAIDPRFESIEEVARTWAERTDLRGIIQAGLAQGYRVVITSDHGHVAGEGIGRPPVGELFEDRSRRVLVFPAKSLWERYRSEAAWKDRYLAFLPAGLAGDCWPLFAADRWAFAYEGTQGVSHGGISLEEAIVPVAEVFAP